MKNITNFLFEVGHLRNIPRAGSKLAGVPNPESVAEHTCRSTFIAFILAHLEGANPERCALICAFHELGETRIGDFHKMASGYFPNKKKVEKTIVQDQLSTLPKEIKQGFWKVLEGEGEDSDKDHIIAKDADYLEMVLTAKEFVERGQLQMELVAQNASRCLKTDGAKKLAKVIVESSSTQWFENLKRIKR